MSLNLLLSVLLVSAKVIDATPSKCCGSKQVGDHKYILQDTDADVPNKCKDACAYTRVGQKGSMYCFSDGNQPVTCAGEMANALYSSGAFSSGDCPIDENVKITDVDPTSNTTQDSAKSCQKFCTSICALNDTRACECQAWTWDSFTLTCFTYNDDFYNATQATGFFTGGPCFNERDQITDVSSDFLSNRVRFRRFGPVGNLRTAKKRFSDYYAARQGGPITKITIYTGKYLEREAITGIEVQYGAIPGGLHGNQGDEANVIDLGEGNNNFITGLFGRDYYQSGFFSIIYRLGLNTVTFEESYGSENFGLPFSFKPFGFKLAYITGTETDNEPAMLGSVNFYFQRI